MSSLGTLGAEVVLHRVLVFLPPSYNELLWIFLQLFFPSHRGLNPHAVDIVPKIHGRPSLSNLLEGKGQAGGWNEYLFLMALCISSLPNQGEYKMSHFAMELIVVFSKKHFGEQVGRECPVAILKISMLCFRHNF